MTVDGATERKRAPRQRILDTAYELISRRGVRDVGVEEVIAKAGIAKATLYRHFPSKTDLVLAVLEQREQLWTLGLVEAEARRRGATAEDRLLAVFDVFDEWFRSDEFDACTFVNVLLEMGPNHVLSEASIRHLGNIRTVIADLATEAGLREPEEFARSWHILMKGSIVSAAEGDTEAARRAQAMAANLIDQYR
ncbi:TetR family transcriptional regulator [Kribbella sp. VKM Ac-2527]|uniref:TetR family transcriptional regulator n=1 Tax=Kribbella caucasensis TaxID=2512215 RepID=A0A4V3C9Z8_9ACTN|nr:TetR/AcrR family transcriptional regulator [Kribbella sp. VKM Ac-2527]TDO47997.1 TetR family transcriptional regulator [Kribbella sp. VKM Ac-2527]